MDVMAWTQEQTDLLKTHYPEKGKKWCVENLGLTEAQVRQKASRLGLRQNRDSEFFKDWQERAATSKIGKKRPDQSVVMKSLHEQGKLKKNEEQRKQISERMINHWKNNEHPRGAKGLVFSEEAKAKISESSKKMWENMPEDKKIAHSRRAAINAQKNLKNREKTSWKAGWREIGGKKKYYRSRWEANYARYLQFLKDRGDIQDWAHESKTFWFDGIKRGCVSYLPDFEVTENSGKVEYHEVKGWMDDRSKTKIARMAKYHPDVELIVIDSKLYKIVEKRVSPFVRGWEF
ncbi:hypothetical protein [Methylomicrobium agile]|uniref:hypothetical protein n=1 Tax=Methylomicrobium agile TaxID=39774 RepID=UPI0014706FC4|nr:hypothetical protein [Methylomicrobium agile]